MSILRKPTSLLLLAAAAGVFFSACSNDPVFVALEQEEKTVDRGLNNSLGIMALDKTFQGKIWAAAGCLYSMPDDGSEEWDKVSIDKKPITSILDTSTAPPWCYDLAVDPNGQLFIAVIDNTNDTHAVFQTTDGSDWTEVKSGSSEYRLFSANDEIQIAVNGSDSWSLENYTDGGSPVGNLGNPNAKITGVAYEGSNYILAYGNTIDDLNDTFDDTYSDAVVEQLFYSGSRLYAALSDNTIRHSSDGSSWTKVTSENTITGLGMDDSSSSVYAGLAGQGLKKISGSSLEDPPGQENYSVIDLSKGTGISFITDTNNTFYVGTQGMGLWKLDDGDDEWDRE